MKSKEKTIHFSCTKYNKEIRIIKIHSSSQFIKQTKWHSNHNQLHNARKEGC